MLSASADELKAGAIYEVKRNKITKFPNLGIQGHSIHTRIELNCT
jgi:hypothetical protein